jgi:phosphopantothenate synthetase
MAPVLQQSSVEQIEINTLHKESNMNEVKKVDETMDALQKLIKDLQNGASVNEVSDRFHRIVFQSDAKAAEPVSRELINQGVAEQKAKRWSQEYIES